MCCIGRTICWHWQSQCAESQGAATAYPPACQRAASPARHNLRYTCSPESRAWNPDTATWAVQSRAVGRHGVRLLQPLDEALAQARHLRNLTDRNFAGGTRQLLCAPTALGVDLLLLGSALLLLCGGGGGGGGMQRFRFGQNTATSTCWEVYTASPSRKSPT